MTFAVPFSKTATQEFVVPKSMPMILAMISPDSDFINYANNVSVLISEKLLTSALDKYCFSQKVVANS